MGNPSLPGVFAVGKVLRTFWHSSAVILPSHIILESCEILGKFGLSKKIDDSALSRLTFLLRYKFL